MRLPGQHSVVPALLVPAVALCLSAFGELSAQESGERSSVPTAGVGGEVVDHDTGEPVRGAAVSLGTGPTGTPGVGTRVTDEEGRFLFRQVPPGTYRLSVTILGYRSMSDTLRVPSEADLDLVLPLSVAPIRLEPIVVEVERRVARGAGRAGEEERRTGAYTVTREQIVERQPRNLSDALALVPGVRLDLSLRVGNAIRLRNGCRPSVWVDGVLIPDMESIDMLVSPYDVERIDVYHAFELPVEFGVNPCGGVVIVTRRGEPAEPGTEGDTASRFVRDLLLVVGALIVAALVTR